MSSLAQVIFFSMIGGVFSLVGGFLLLASKKRAHALATYATPFAAGALLAAAFVDLLREAARAGSAETALTFTMVGILVFFLLERFLRWFHHHHEHEKNKSTDPTIALIVIGDTLHNFIDGIAIAAGFLISPSTGIVVTLAVAAHEIPQEIGDFGLLLHKGMDRAKVIWVNIIGALATTVAAVLFFQLGQSAQISFDAVIGLIAGFFIYIAVSDVIPSIHQNEDKTLAGWQSVLLVVGAVVVGAVTVNLHKYIDQGQDHDHQETHSMNQHQHTNALYEHENHATLPTIELRLDEDAASGWNLEVVTTNFAFSPEQVNGANMPGKGHAHLYINGEKTARLYSPHYHIDSLEAGDKVRVSLNANNHSGYAHGGEVIQATMTVDATLKDEHAEDNQHNHGTEHSH